MKAWIRDSYYMTKIPAKRLSDNALLHISPFKDDPAEQIPSERDDGIETIEWRGQVFDVPELDELEGWVFDSVCETLDGDMVEPDGWNVEGCPSWLLVLGLV